MGALGAGILLLALFALIWAGPLRGALDAPLWPYASITIVPGLGVALVAVGLQSLGVIAADSPVGTLAFLVALVGAVLAVWQPRWWGPRWYREANRRKR